MRMFGLIGLVLALLVVGVLVRKQMAVMTPSTVPSVGLDAGTRPTVDTPAQGRQIEQQFKQSLDAATQPRPMPDDAK